MCVYVYMCVYIYIYIYMYIYTHIHISYVMRVCPCMREGIYHINHCCYDAADYDEADANPNSNTHTAIIANT